MKSIDVVVQLGECWVTPSAIEIVILPRSRRE
jgi:hypothetical protein